jgi:hypothetical protein
MHLLFLLYLLSLGAMLVIGVRSPFLRLGPLLVAVFLLIWIDLVLTAQVLSLFSALSSMAAYVATSLAIAIMLGAGLRMLPLTHEVALPEFSNPFSPRVSRVIFWFLLTTGSMALLINVVLAWGLLPANPDSIVYRFPRAYWYLWHGSLTHFSNSGDPRVLYYPFNGTLLYFPLIHFRLDPRMFSFPSLTCWLVIALTTYQFARNLGGPRLFAVATAWLICLTPNILLQALSTNDEILAATAMLAGLFFMHRWFVGRQTFDAVVGVVGIGVSAGSKLHVTFYWPLLIGIAVMLLVHHHASFRELRNWSGRRLVALAIALCLSVVIAFSFIAYNYISTGQLTAWAFNDQVLNKPFNWHASVQTVTLYAAQMILTPFADLHVVFTSALRGQHYEAFNRLLAPMFNWVDNGAAFTSADYRFIGVNARSASVFNEHTIFIGFTWLVFVIAYCGLSAMPRTSDALWARFHLASFPVWMVTSAASTRYVDGFSVYLGYATIVAAPVLVFAFAPLHRRGLDRARWIVLALVAATHCFFTGSIFLSSSPRNLILLMRAPEWPASRGASVDASVEDEISRSPAGIVNRSISWGQPFWATMMHHPEIPQFLADPRTTWQGSANATMNPAPFQLRPNSSGIMSGDGDRMLRLFLFPQSPVYGQVLAVRVPDMVSSGLTWIGDAAFSFGPEWVFAAGNDVARRHPGRDKFILVKYFEQQDTGSIPVLRMSPEIFGFGEKDDLSFRMQMKIDGKVTQGTEWMRVPRFDLPMPGPDQGAVLTLFVRNEKGGGTVYSTDVALRGIEPVQLQEAAK